MDFAHRSNIVHRDLKPENVQLGEFGEVFVTDWGVAKHFDKPNPDGEGMIIGTAAYMAPEQAAGREDEVDARSDIYALGVMLYEVLTLTRPYHAETRQHWLEAAKNVVPLPPSSVARDRLVPPDLETLCMRMLAKSREQRPQSMRGASVAASGKLAKLRSCSTVAFAPASVKNLTSSRSAKSLSSTV